MLTKIRNKKHLIIIASSGIGNTLFQSAYALSMCEDCGVSMRMVCSTGNDPRYKRESEQALFTLKQLAVPHTKLSLINVKILLRTAIFIARVFPRIIEIRKERDQEYDPVMASNLKSLITIVHSSLLPSHRYFGKEYTFLSRWKAIIARKGIRQRFGRDVTVVGVHLRIYESDSGQVNIDQYLSHFRNAVAKIESSDGSKSKLVYLIFSNKKCLALELLSILGIEKYIFEDHLDLESDFHALAYLATCDYIVLSPSTFSWWAAYFKSERRTVFAPRNEFGEREHLFPEWLSDA